MDGDIRGKKKVNKWIGIGRLTRDPELSYTPKGTAIARFYLAVQRNYKSEKGEYEADFIPIVVWREFAEFCAKHLQKGRLVAVSGRIQTRSYESDKGQRRYTWEVIADEIKFLDYPKNQQMDDAPLGFTETEINDDELPF